MSMNKRDVIKNLVSLAAATGGGIVAGKLMKSQYEQNGSTVGSVVELIGYLSLMIAGGAVASKGANAVTGVVCSLIDEFGTIKAEREEAIEEETAEEEEEA